MMRLFFWALLLANGILLTVLWQAAGTPSKKKEGPSITEIAPERLTLLSARPLVRRAAEGECIEVGTFTTQTALKFESALGHLSLKELPKKRLIQPPPSYLVFLPPQQGEAAAQRRLAQVQGLGFTDIAVIRENGERRWGLSLGVFTSPALADARLKSLKSAGVTDARVEEHPINSSRFAYELRGLDRQLKTELQSVQSNFDGTTLQACSTRADAAGTINY